ncbi:DUF4361 domain-containing protein [Puteibacter caeruleilacunae]|nr:DUF4361 domain-containing protein [Puteibacter caeruleilacunae]
MKIVKQKTFIKMKNISIYLLLLCCSLAISSCEDDLLKDEQYESIIYLLSGSKNIYDHEIDLNNDTDSLYVTIGSSGTKPVSKDVNVELEENLTLIDDYNKRNFDIDTDKYAKRMPLSRIDVASLSTTLKAGTVDNKSRLLVKLNAQGLSVDTTYLIPYQIKSVSNFKVNEEKNNALVKLYFKNDYCSQKTVTTYFMKGDKKSENAAEDAAPIKIAASKRFLPIAANEVRLFPSTVKFSTKLEDIENKAMKLVITGDKVVVKPYKNVEVEDLGTSTYEKLNKIFHLHYRYNDNGEWFVVNEKLRLID